MVLGKFPSSKAFADVLENQRRAATIRGRGQMGGFAVEGLRMVRRGVAAGYQPQQLLLGKSIISRPEVKALSETVSPFYVVPDELLLANSQGRRSGLVQALFKLPSASELRELIEQQPDPLFLVLLKVDEPGNVGALIRTGLASGVQAVIYAGGTDPFHPKAVRTSLGSLFRVPLIDGRGLRVPKEESEPCTRTLAALHSLGVHTLATTPRGGESLLSIDLPRGPVALILGNEGQGLTPQLQASASQKLSIEQSEQADSYSVNAAAAICLFEIRRRLG